MTQVRPRTRFEIGFTAHAAGIISRVKRLDPSCLQSGDSRLGNVWEEYKVQVQLEQSLFFSSYCDTIRRIVEQAVDSMPQETVAALWRLTPEAEEWEAGNIAAHPALCAETVEEELFRRVQRAAADEPLPHGLA